MTLNRKTYILLTAMIVVAVAVAYFSLQDGALRNNNATPPNNPIQRRVRYGFEVKNTSNILVEDATVSVFAPLKHGAFQERLELESNLPLQVQDNTPQLTLTIPPYGTKVVSLSALTELYPYDRDIAPAPAVTTDTTILPEIQALAKKLLQGSDTDNAKAIYDWVRGNIEAIGYVKSSKGLERALKDRSGDCTEFSLLMHALAQANGIPSRIASGFYLEQDRVLRPIDLHSWPEFYVSGRWRIYDAHKGLLDAPAQNYVTFASIESADGEVLRFSSSHPDLEISMR